MRLFLIDENAKNNFRAELICLGAGLGSNTFKSKLKKKLNIYYDEGLGLPVLVQGPKPHDILRSIMSQSQTQVPARFQHVMFNFEGQTTLISRNSYSGDDGFEIFVRDTGALKIWSQPVGDGG